MLAGNGLFDILDQTHLHRTIGTHGFKPCQCFGIGVDVFLQLGTGVTDIGGIDEDGRNTGVDHGRLEGPHARHFELIHQVAGGEHGAFAIGGIHELDHYLGCREGHAIQFEITGFLYLTVGDRHMGDDGFLDVLLPDAHSADAVFRHALGIDQPLADGKGAHRSGQVAAVAGPVHKRLVDRHLTEEIVHVVIGLFTLGQNDGFGGTGRGATHAIDLLTIGVGTADHALQDFVTGFTRHLSCFRQIGQVEENTLGGAATDIGGRNFDLGNTGH